MSSTDVIARSVKVAVPIHDSDFPVFAIPAKGIPGGAKARMTLRIVTPDGLSLLAEPAAKSLQKALEAAQAAPGGWWVAQGKLGPTGQILEAGVVYQPPRQTEPAAQG